MISVIIYLLTFAISIFVSYKYQESVYADQKFYNKETKQINYQKILFIVAIILAPVIISTIRYNVGTDYESYQKLFGTVNALRESGQTFTYIPTEPLFFVINYIAGWISKNGFWMVLFASSAVLHTFIVLSLDRLGKKVWMPLGLFVFYMMFFANSLNITRQMIAAAIVLYGITYLLEKNFKKYIIFVLIATMFHMTALFSLSFLILVVDFNKLSKRTQYIVLMTLFLFPILFPLLLNLAAQIPLLYRKLANYIAEFNGFGLGFIIDLLPLLIPVTVYRKELLANKKDFNLFINLAVFSIPVRMLGYTQIWFSRIIYYITIVLVILIPRIYVEIKKKRDPKIDLIVIIAIGLFYYFFYFVYRNYGETYPFKTFLFS